MARPARCTQKQHTTRNTGCNDHRIVACATDHSQRLRPCTSYRLLQQPGQMAVHRHGRLVHRLSPGKFHATLPRLPPWALFSSSSRAASRTASSDERRSSVASTAPAITFPAPGRNVDIRPTVATRPSSFAADPPRRRSIPQQPPGRRGADASAWCQRGSPRQRS